MKFLPASPTRRHNRRRGRSFIQKLFWASLKSLLSVLEAMHSNQWAPNRAEGVNLITWPFRLLLHPSGGCCALKEASKEQKSSSLSPAFSRRSFSQIACN